MKREATPANSDDSRPSTPVTPTKKSKSSNSPPKTPRKTTPQPNGIRTPEKRERFFDVIIAAGYKTVNLDELGEELQLNKQQLINQLVPNRANMRRKAVQFIAGDGAGKVKGEMKTE